MAKDIAIVENLIIKKGGEVIQPPFSFTWKQGQHWCVTGSTGSGKTSLLKILSGLSFPMEGKLSYPFLEEFKKQSKKQIFISDMIAYVSQEVKIPSHYIEDLYYQRRFQATEQDEIPNTFEILLKVAQNDMQEAEDAAHLLGLENLLTQPFVQLSNGQTRRLMIAIALIKKPKLLILDNPYTGLDQDARLELNQQLKSLISHGIHIFMAAHEHELLTLDFITNTLRLKDYFLPTSSSSIPARFLEHQISPSSEVIKMKNLKIQYDRKVVLNIPEWIVSEGEKWVIQGKNGSGKSTLLSVIMADHPQAYSNEIYLFGNPRGSGESIWEVKRKMGFFSPELLRFFSKREKIAQVIASGWSDYVGKVSVLSKEREQQVEEIATWLGIQSLLNLKFGDLSLGQQKMILIARAMFRNPSLLILDEPLQGMDVQWRDHFREKIQEFALNRTVLYVTHDEEEIPPGDWKYLNL